MSASSILRTSVVYDGWAFPPCGIVPADEKYLFDVEAR